jgi:hypothetical protein
MFTSLRPSPSVLTTPSQPVGRFRVYLPSGSSNASFWAKAQMAPKDADKNNSKQKRFRPVTMRFPSN